MRCTLHCLGQSTCQPRRPSELRILWRTPTLPGTAFPPLLRWGGAQAAAGFTNENNEAMALMAGPFSSVEFAPVEPGGMGRDFCFIERRVYIAKLSHVLIAGKEAIMFQPMRCREAIPRFRAPVFCATKAAPKRPTKLVIPNAENATVTRLLSQPSCADP